MSHKAEKLKLIHNLLRDINTRKVRHYNKFKYYKKINTGFKTTVNILNGVSISSLVLSLPGNLITLGISIGCTSTSALLSIINQSIDYENKFRLHQTSYLQYVDIYRDVNARIMRNHLTSEDLDNILTEMNSRIGLIEDNSLPIRMSPNSPIKMSANRLTYAKNN